MPPDEVYRRGGGVVDFDPVGIVAEIVRDPGFVAGHELVDKRLSAGQHLALLEPFNECDGVGSGAPNRGLAATSFATLECGPLVGAMHGCSALRLCAI